MKKTKDYRNLIISYLLIHLFGKPIPIFTFNRSRKIDTVNNFSKAQSLINFGDTNLYGEHYHLYIGWDFPPEKIGSEDDLSRSFIGISFHNLLDDSGILAFNEMIRDLENFGPQMIVKDEYTSLDHITKAAKSCDPFCDQQLLKSSGIAVIDEESEKLRMENYLDNGDYLDNTLPLSIFYQYLKLGDTNILSYTRIHDCLKLLNSSGDFFNLYFEDLTLTNDIIQKIAKNFKSHEIHFHNCLIPADIDFTPLDKRNLFFRNMDVRIYQLYSLTGEITLDHCNIDLTSGINNQLKLSKLFINRCKTDLELLFFRFFAPNLTHLTIFENSSFKKDELVFLPSFAPNLTSINLSDNVPYLDFLIQLLKLNEIIINYNDPMCPLIFTTDYDRNLIRRNNASEINEYCREHHINDISDELLPYFEKARIGRLANFYQKIMINGHDFKELMKYPSIYSYIMSQEITNLNRGYHLYNGFMTYHPDNLDGLDWTTISNSSERELVRVGNILGTKLKYCSAEDQPIYLGIGPLIYASDGRPIILQKCPYTGKYYTKQSNDPVYSMIESKLMQEIFDCYTTPFDYEKSEGEYSPRGIRWLETIGGAHLIDIYSAENVKKFVDYLNINYHDSMPEFTRCFNEYYQLLLSEKQVNPDAIDAHNAYDNAKNLYFETIYNHLDQLSINELYYIYDKSRLFIGNRVTQAIIIKGIEKYDIQTDLSSVDLNHINVILQFDLDDFLKKLARMFEECQEIEREEKKDVLITEQAVLEILNMPKNNPDSTNRILSLKKRND